MDYSKKTENRNTTQGSNVFSGANAQRKEAAVPVLQKATEDEELQKKSAVVQKVEKEEDKSHVDKILT